MASAEEIAASMGFGEVDPVAPPSSPTVSIADIASSIGIPEPTATIMGGYGGGKTPTAKEQNAAMDSLLRMFVTGADYIVPETSDVVTGAGIESSAGVGAGIGRGLGGLAGSFPITRPIRPLLQKGGGAIGGAIGSIFGAAGGKQIGDVVDTAQEKLLEGDLSSIPSIPLGEPDFGRAMIEGPAGALLMKATDAIPEKLMQYGQRKVNRATEKYANAVGAESRDFAETVLDELGRESVPELGQSIRMVDEMGLISSSGSGTRGGIQYNVDSKIKELGPKVTALLEAKQNQLNPQPSDIVDTVKAKIDDMRTYLYEKYPSIEAKKEIDDALLSITDNVNNISTAPDSLVKLNQLKKEVDDTTKFNPNLAAFDNFKNSIKKKAGAIYRQAIDELTGDDSVKSLNSQLGALYDVSDILRTSAAKGKVERTKSAAEFFSMLLSNPMFGPAVAGSTAGIMGRDIMEVGQSAAAGMLIPTAYGTYSYLKSPSGLIVRGRAEDAVGKLSRSLGTWMDNAPDFMKVVGHFSKNGEVINALDIALKSGAGQQAAKYMNELVKETPELLNFLEPPEGIFTGLSSYFGTTIVDAQERTEYADRLTTAEQSKPFLERDYKALSKKLTALNRDGSVIDAPVSKRVQKQAPNSVEGVAQDGEALANEEAPLTKGVVTGLADGVKVNRSSYSY